MITASERLEMWRMRNKGLTHKEIGMWFDLSASYIGSTLRKIPSTELRRCRFPGCRALFLPKYREKQKRYHSLACWQEHYPAEMRLVRALRGENDMRVIGLLAEML